MLKDILSIIASLMLAVGILICIALSVDACTQQEQDKVFGETARVCKVFNKTCTVHVVKYEGYGAQTRYGGDIYITNSLANRLNEKQLRSVMYHEVGHVVLEHIEKTAQELYNCKQSNSCNPEQVSAIHRKYEYQADRFSVLTTLFTGKGEGLSEALTIITPPDQFYKTQATHPSTADRIEAINKLTGGFYGR